MLIVDSGTCCFVHRLVRQPRGGILEGKVHLVKLGRQRTHCKEGGDHVDASTDQWLDWMGILSTHSGVSNGH